MQLLRVSSLVSLLILVSTQSLLGQRVTDTEEFMWPSIHDVPPNSKLIESELPTLFIQKSQEQTEEKSCGRRILLGMGAGALVGETFGYVVVAKDDDSDGKKWSGFGFGILGSVAGLLLGTVSCT